MVIRSAYDGGVSTTSVPSSAPAPSADRAGDPGAATDEHPLDGDLGFSLAVVFRTYQQVVNAAMADVPGGPRGYRVLATATHDLPRTQLALAQQLGMDRTVMTYLLDDLEGAGLVERRPDPADRRARQVAVTAAGCTLLAALHKRLKRAEEHVLGALTEDERTTFRVLLARLTGQMLSDQSAPGGCVIVEEADAAVEVKLGTSGAKPRRRRP